MRRCYQWQWDEAARNNWSTGAFAVQTEEWWWQGFIDLTLYITEFGGERHCQIDNLKVSQYSSYTDVRYDPYADSCSGDTGSASTPAWAKALLQYYLEDRETDAVFEATSQVNDRVQCLNAIAQGLAGTKSRFSVGWECKFIVEEPVKAILQRYGKQIDFQY